MMPDSVGGSAVGGEGGHASHASSHWDGDCRPRIDRRSIMISLIETEHKPNYAAGGPEVDAMSTRHSQDHRQRRPHDGR